MPKATRSRTIGRRGEQIALRRFGQNVRKQRLALGLTREDLASSVGVNGSYITRIEQGLRSPTLWSILRLARAMDVIPAKLMNGL